LQPLIDADILTYEVASVAQYLGEDGEIHLRPWDWVEETLDWRIKAICDSVQATQEPILYLTVDEKLHKMNTRSGTFSGDFQPNFRIERAKLRTYKGTRKSDKPLYYNSIRAYLFVTYNTVISCGCEADDEMAMEQSSRPDSTIICTRDKDLRQVPGHHYGWETGLQAEFGPKFYDEFGTLALDRTLSSPKLVGGGFLFFGSQLLTGDTVDNIAGLKGYGPIKTFDLIGATNSIPEVLAVVRAEYEKVYPSDWRENLREQCDLLWLVRKRDSDGRLVMFNPKEFMNV
jgi:hypothetical protein